jgi:hypothetical protein
MASDRDLRFPTLAEALDASLSVGGLRKLSALFPGRSPTRKGELVEHVVGQLAGDGLRAAWERLDELQRAAVAEVVHGPSPVLDRARFHAKYGAEPAWGSVSEWARGEPATPLRLFLHGAGVLPDDLKRQLSVFVPAPRTATIASSAELPEEMHLTVRETERTAQLDLLRVLRAIEQGKVSVSDKTRRPSAAAVRAVAEVLAGGDFYDLDGEPGPIKAFAWPLLVQAGRLAELAGSRLRLTRAGHNALLAPPSGTLRVLWQRWLDATLLDELSRIDAIKGQTGKGKRSLTALAGRRAAIRDALAACPAGRWIAVGELFRFMRASGHDFAVTRDRWPLYVADPQYGSLGYQGFGGWHILEGRYARCLLFEYAATLGLLDVAHGPPGDAPADFRNIWGTDELSFFSRYDGLAFIRLTPLGAHCLSDAAYETEPAPEAPPVPAEKAEKSGGIKDRGEARLFECESPALAARLAGDPRMRRVCMLAGDRHLAVPARSAAAFGRALEALGYGAASGERRE